MRTKLLTSMAATLLLVAVGSAAVAATGVEADTTDVADEAVAGDQDQLRLRERDELCDPIGDEEQCRYGSTESSATTVDPDRDQDQIRADDQDRTRDQLRDDSCEPDEDGRRDRDRDGTGLTGDAPEGTPGPVGEQVRTQTRAQVQTQLPTQLPTQAQAQVQSREQIQDRTEEPAQSREEAQIETRVQEESQHLSREQAGAPDARGQH